jgi:hypothetical protein
MLLNVVLRNGPARRCVYKPIVFAGVLLLHGAAGTAASAGDWPGWRNNGSGVSEETGLPDRWSSTENILWKTRVPGSGVSSPIVWKDRVVVTTTVEGATLGYAHRYLFSACSSN